MTMRMEAAFKMILRARVDTDHFSAVRRIIEDAIDGGTADFRIFLLQIHIKVCNGRVVTARFQLRKDQSLLHRASFLDHSIYLFLSNDENSPAS